MTTYFSDTFGGAVASSIQGRVPDVTTGAGTWNNGYLIATDGSNAYFSGTGTTNAGGYASINYGTNPGNYSSGSPLSGTLQVAFTTGPTVATSSDGHRGVGFSIGRTPSSGAPNELYVKAYAPANGTWVVVVKDEYSTVLMSQAISVVANTAYAVSLSFDETGYIVTFNGSSYSGSFASSGKRVSYIGIPDIGVGIKVNSVELVSYTAPVAITANIAMSATKPSMAASGGSRIAMSAAKPSMSIAVSPTGAPATPVSAQVTMQASKAGMYVTAHDSTGENAISMTASKASMTLRTGANVAMGASKAFMSAAATASGLASFAVSAAKGAMQAIATVTALSSIAMAAPAGRMSATGGANIGMNANKGSMSVTGRVSETAQISMGASKGRMTAVATVYGVASIAMQPSAGYMGGHSARITMSATPGRMSAVASAAVTATYEAYAVNLKHKPRSAGQDAPVDEVTRYTDFPFTHIVRYQGSYYGASATGLYLLEGTTDGAVPVSWAVQTGTTDFKSPNKKTLASAYFGGRLGPASTIQLHAGEQTPNTYSFTTPRSALAQNYRQVFGRGLKARYYSIGLSGEAALQLDSIDLDVRNLTRKI